MANVKKIYDMVAVIGKYTNKNGEEKNEFTNIGKFFVMDDGSFFSKMTSVPVNWNGTISYYEQKQKEAVQAQPQQSAQVQQSAPVQNNIGDSSGLPF